METTATTQEKKVEKKRKRDEERTGICLPWLDDYPDYARKVCYEILQQCRSSDGASTTRLLNSLVEFGTLDSIPLLAYKVCGKLAEELVRYDQPEKLVAVLNFMMKEEIKCCSFIVRDNICGNRMYLVEKACRFGSYHCLAVMLDSTSPFFELWFGRVRVPLLDEWMYGAFIRLADSTFNNETEKHQLVCWAMIMQIPGCKQAVKAIIDGEPKYKESKFYKFLEFLS